MTQPTYTYLVRYDRDDDGNFRGDLSTDLLDLKIENGMRNPYDTVGQVSTAQMIVRNPDGRYSPEEATSTLQPGLTVSITCVTDGATYQLFEGSIASIEPHPGTVGERRALITAECPMRALVETRVRLNARTDVRAGEIVSAVLDQVPTRVRFLGVAFIVGVAGRAELGQNTRLPSSAALIPRAIEGGRSRFAYVGDRWDDGVQALDAIEEVTEAERGRFYVSRGSSFIFLARRTLFTPLPTVTTLSDDMNGVRVVYGAGIVNRVEVTLRPRRTGASDDVLWTLGQAQRVPAGQARRFKARFRSTSGERIGALNVLPPRPYADYTANSDPAGVGNDLTGVVEFGLVGWDGSTAEMQLTNPGTSDAYLMPGAVVRGRALYATPPITVEARDPLSETLYGPRLLVLNLPALTSIEEAEDIARFERFRRANPRTVANRLELRGNQHRERILATNLFNRVTVVESQAAHSGDYFVIGQAHHVYNGGASHEVRWTLEPVNPAGFWQVSFGTLGETTRLAY